MSWVVRIPFYLIYYIIAVPMCVFALIFWLVRVVTTVALMVFAMLVEAWRKKGVSPATLRIIENVMKVGPDVVSAILTAPFKDPDKQPTDPSPQSLFWYEVGYSAVFIAATAGVIFFRGFIQGVGAALKSPEYVFEGGLAGKLVVGYLILSCGISAYLLTADQLEEGVFKRLVVPANLVISGLVATFFVYNAVMTMR